MYLVILIFIIAILIFTILEDGVFNVKKGHNDLYDETGIICSFLNKLIRKV